MQKSIDTINRLIERTGVLTNLHNVDRNKSDEGNTMKRENIKSYKDIIPKLDTNELSTRYKFKKTIKLNK